MQSTKSYKVITGMGATALGACESLEAHVTESISEGYVPIGGVTIAEQSLAVIAAQAMYREYHQPKAI